MSRVPGTFKNEPAQLKRALDDRAAYAEALVEASGGVDAQAWTLGECSVMVSRELHSYQYRWHLSIAHPSRYPTWDEIKAVAYGLDCLAGVTLAQVFTPQDGSVWVNAHDNCFHLFEIRDPLLDPA